MNGPGTNTGHGHVWTRPDGMKARCGGPTVCRECSRVAAALAATSEKAERGAQGLTTCNCRWNGDQQVQQCTLHEAHTDAIHEWAERAKVAEGRYNTLSDWWFGIGVPKDIGQALTFEELQAALDAAPPAAPVVATSGSSAPVVAPPTQPAQAEEVKTVRQFQEWLNDRRMNDVSSVFHEIVAHYRAALTPRPAATAAVPEGREARLRAAMERMDHAGPLPGMIAAFEQQFGQTWTDRDWRQEASIWSAAWRAALTQRSAAPLATDAGVAVVKNSLTADELTDAARYVGLRSAMHGYSITDVRSILRAFVNRLASAQAKPATADAEVRVPLTEELHTFLNAAAGEGYVLDGVDAGDLYQKVFPGRYAALTAQIITGAELRPADMRQAPDSGASDSEGGEPA